MIKVLLFLISLPLLLILLLGVLSLIFGSLQHSNMPPGGNVPPCVVNASAEVPASGKTEEPIPLSAKVVSTTCTETLTYEWSFGDGNGNSFVQGNNQSHIYKNPGVYHWEVRINANGTTRFGQGGQIKIAPSSRLIVALFSGFGNDPYASNGMTQLLSEIREDFVSQLRVTVFAQVFTFDNKSKEQPDAVDCQSTASALNARPRCALNWILSQNPTPEDKIVLIGHSYGGNSARRLSYQLGSLNQKLTVYGLITIDPIDWDRCTPIDALDLNTSSKTGLIDVDCKSDCSQMNLELDCPSTVIRRISYTQTQGVYIDKKAILSILHKYDLETPPVFSPCLRGYRLANSEFHSYPSERHDTIDDNPAIHREIRQFLATLITSPSLPPGSMVTTFGSSQNKEIADNKKTVGPSDLLKPSVAASIASPSPIPSPVIVKGTLAYPGKFTELGAVKYCKDAPIAMLIKPSATCDFYVTAGGSIWRPNKDGIVDTKVGSDVMNKSLKVWLKPNTPQPVTFSVDFVNCR